jgi:hypothetical protein
MKKGEQIKKGIKKTCIPIRNNKIGWDVGQSYH